MRSKFVLPSLICAISLLFALGPGFVPVLQPAGDGGLRPGGPLNVDAAYGRLALSFAANAGQAEPGFDYVSRGPGYRLLLAPTEAVLMAERPRPAGILQRLGHLLPDGHAPPQPAAQL